MAINVSCGQCFYGFSVKDSLAGKRVKCPGCGAPVRAVSGGQAPPAAAPAPAPRRSRSKQSRKRKSSGGNGLLIGLGIGGGVLLLGAVVIAAFLLGRSSGDAPGDPAADTIAATNSDPSPFPDESVSGDPVAVVETSAPEEMVDPATSEPTDDEGTEVASAAAEPDENNPDETTDDDDGLPPLPAEDLDLPDLIELVEKSVVRIHVNGEYGGSTGSGFVVDKEGAIVTNYHVMEGAVSAEAEFNTGEKVPITGFWKLDEVRDLAIVKVDIPAERLFPIRIAAEVPRKGIAVAAFGAPLGLSFTASEGIVSATREAAEVSHDAGVYVQTTAPISPGNSGGPLVNMRGEVVGANSFQTAEGENLNFAISSVDILDVLQDKGTQVTQVSPQTIPVKVSGGFGGAENLVGTERGALLLSQIRDAIVIIQPFSYDPTGRITDYLETSAERAILDRVGWDRIRRTSQIKGSTAIVVVVTYFRVGDQTTDDNLVSELVIQMEVVARDVDREGRETLAVVWSEKEPVGTTSLASLLNGRVTRTIESGVSSFFRNFVTDYRRAGRETRE